MYVFYIFGILSNALFCFIFDQLTVSWDSFATYKVYQVEEKEEVFGETETALRCHICEHKINQY